MPQGDSQVSVVDCGVKSVVLYSSDRDLCASLQLLFQDSYEFIAPHDFDGLREAVDHSANAVLIADVLPTERIGTLFSQLKHSNPALHIILFFAPRFHDKPLPESIRNNVDSVLYKPVDLESVTMRISEYFQNHDQEGAK